MWSQHKLEEAVKKFIRDNPQHLSQEELNKIKVKFKIQD
jgi:hypothetical protein